MAGYTQEKRLISIAVEGYAADDLLLKEIVEGREAISSLFNYKISLFSLKEIEPGDILGKAATIRMTLPNSNQKRVFNGLISSWTLTGGSFTNTAFLYEAELSPTLWLASQCRNYKTFPNTDALTVVSQILTSWNVANDVSKLTVTAPELEMIVQYGESDFAFISRLLESVGVFYMFVHAPSNNAPSGATHTMTLLNANPKPTQTAPYNIELESIGISKWRTGERLGPVSTQVSTFNYRTGANVNGNANTTKPATSNNNQPATASSNSPLVVNAAESGWPTPTTASDFQNTVNTSANNVAVAIRNSQFDWRGETVNRTLLPGSAFTLTCFPMLNSKNRDVLIRETVIKANNAAYYIDNTHPHLDSEKDIEEAFSCSLVCSDLAVKFQPSVLTPKPLATGTEQGMVINSTTVSAAPTILTDQWGRVQVMLNWGHQTITDQIFWARVLQPRTGNTSGDFSLPISGQEVVISFLGGDPDSPVVTGCLYNQVNPPPVAIAGNNPMPNYSSVIRHPSVNTAGALAAASLPTAAPALINISTLAKTPNNFNEISFWNMQSSAETDAETLGSSDNPLEGINIYSNNSVLNQAAQSQVMQAGEDIVITAGRSITLQVGRSSIVITDGAVELLHSLFDSPTPFDSSLTLESLQAELASFQTWVTGLVMVDVYSGILESSIQACLWDVEISGASISNSATGFLGNLRESIVGLVNLAVSCVSSSIPTTENNPGSGCNVASDVFAGIGDVVSLYYLVEALYEAIGKKGSNMKSLLAPTTSEIAMTGFGVTTTAPMIDLKSDSTSITGDAAAGLGKKAAALLGDLEPGTILNVSPLSYTLVSDGMETVITGEKNDTIFSETSEITDRELTVIESVQTIDSEDIAIAADFTQLVGGVGDTTVVGEFNLTFGSFTGEGGDFDLTTGDATISAGDVTVAAVAVEFL